MLAGPSYKKVADDDTSFKLQSNWLLVALFLHDTFITIRIRKRVLLNDYFVLLNDYFVLLNPYFCSESYELGLQLSTHGAHPKAFSRSEIAAALNPRNDSRFRPTSKR